MLVDLLLLVDLLEIWPSYMIFYFWTYLRWQPLPSRQKSLLVLGRTSLTTAVSIRGLRVVGRKLAKFSWSLCTPQSVRFTRKSTYKEKRSHVHYAVNIRGFRVVGRKLAMFSWSLSVRFTRCFLEGKWCATIYHDPYWAYLGTQVCQWTNEEIAYVTILISM